jgi:hypothetical protein
MLKKEIEKQIPSNIDPRQIARKIIVVTARNFLEGWDD